jgi:uncharacterized protein (TIGR02271 family)
MAMTVVGLFDDRSDAQSALRELSAAGFVESDTQSIMDNADSVHGALHGHGVPADDIRAYENGVRSGDSLIVVHTDNNRAATARDIMNRFDAIDIHHATHRARGMSTASATASAPMASAGSRTVAAGETITVPVVEEHLSVGKRQIERGGARIHTHVVEKPVSETVTLRQEEVVVERHAVNRPATGADLTNALQEKTIAVTERSEVPVVAKEARVVEEITVGKQTTERTETVSDTVRRTDVDVEELNSGDSSVMNTGRTMTTR